MWDDILFLGQKQLIVGSFEKEGRKREKRSRKRAREKRAKGRK